ncbi:CHAP domain-containing protein [uncultured Oscillibacter sp.]|uniref:CHAP domain-containing protein n=1 Tax=uncultured Oscillibacter sp. TaxID=876091 RepID=UPI0021736B0B|nr:CHAP domain-containing protein [uncultured Oscillibacter sp.]MCI9554795.1 CHAP domain-containing protein [Oscillibacter sp.]
MKPVEKLLDIARGELGTAESPANSNRVKYNTWYYGREVSGAAYPWCMVFVQWCFDQAGVPLPVKTASCGAMRSAAQKAGQWVTGDYRPGDVVIYDFPGGAATDHTGIVEKVTASGVAAIEGNTSQSGSQSNGGQVCRKTRPAGQIVGAVRPRFEEEETDMDNVPSPAHQEGVEWAKEMGILTGDGSGDLKLTEPVTRQQMCTMLYRFAKKKGLSPEAETPPGEAPGTQSVEKR